MKASSHTASAYQSRQPISLPGDDLWDYLYGDGLYESMQGILNRLIGDEQDCYDQHLRDPKAPEALQHCLAQAMEYFVAKKVVSVETYGSWLSVCNIPVFQYNDSVDEQIRSRNVTL